MELCSPRFHNTFITLVYRERPQTGTVFTNKDEMDKLIDSLAWYSKSRKDRAYQGTNNILPHRYRIRTYNNNNQGK